MTLLMMYKNQFYHTSDPKGVKFNLEVDLEVFSPLKSLIYKTKALNNLLNPFQTNYKLLNFNYFIHLIEFHFNPSVKYKIIIPNL
jgi:hypothetical protein